jgi:hypothetical protein
MASSVTHAYYLKSDVIIYEKTRMSQSSDSGCGSSVCDCRVGMETHSSWQSLCSNLIASCKEGRKMYRASVYDDLTYQFA